MIFEALKSVLRGLNEADVRYLVAGGMAVNAHGYQRLTRDLDLVLDLDRANVLAAFAAFEDLGYAPALPVPAEAFADPEARSRWHDERNMEVFSFRSDRASGFAIDVFVREPFDFEREFERAFVADVTDLAVPFVALDTLIRMKEQAGRARDRDDVEHLRWVEEETADDA